MPDPATPKLRDLAKRLLIYEAGLDNDSVPPAVHVCNKLRRPLATLAGNTGFHSLLARSLALAKEEAPALRAVQVTVDGGLDFSEQNHSNPERVDNGEIVLVAQLLGLLAILIGEPLTLRLVRDLWPDVGGDHTSTRRKNYE